MNPDFWKRYKTFLVVSVIILLALRFFGAGEEEKNDVVVKTDVSYTEFLNLVKEGYVLDVVVQGQELFVTDRDQKKFKLYAPQHADLINILRESGVNVTSKPPEEMSPLVRILFSWFPFIVLIGIWLFFMRRMQGSGGGGSSAKKFTKSLARTTIPETRFTDVAGVDEAVEEVKEIVEFLKNPDKFTRLGAKIPKGVLLVGRPGTGKTLLARAVAGEAGVPVFSIGGSEFVELYVGVGAGRVRDLFAQAKKSTPCIIFVDEIDAMGKSRGAGVGQTHNEGEQTLNQLFIEMDGFEVNEGIIVIAATNRPDTLDPALLRPGRFSRQVEVPLTDINGREKILKVHTKNIILSEDVNLSEIARGTPMYSGAQLEEVCNEAAILASRNDKEVVEMEDFWKAKDRIDMGIERKMHVSDKDREITATHEAGHALIGVLVPGHPVNKVSIIPRGRAMGVTSFLPEEDQYFYTKEFLFAEIKSTLGGRIAEEVIFTKDFITTGAQSDLIAVTSVARRMVCDWAMSDDLPLRSYGSRQEMVFLGRELGRDRDYGEELANRIDGAVQKIIDDCTKEVREIIEEKKEELKQVTKLLLKKETITGDEVKKIVFNKI